MAKRIKKLERFEGGLNKGSAERDIEDTQLVEASNISLHNIGSLKLLGEFVEHEATSGEVTEEISGTSTKPGYGLFSFQSDYKMLDSSTGAFLPGTSPTIGASKYLLVYSTTNNASAAIFQNNGGTKVWSDANDGNDEIDLGGETANLVFYSYNGAARIADASNTASNITQWVGPITPKIYGASKAGPTPEAHGDTQTYELYDGGAYFTRNEAFVYRTSEEGGTSGVGATNAKWIKTNNEIKGAFEEVDNGDGDKCCLNAIMSSTASTFAYQGSTYGNTIAAAEVGGFGFGDEHTDTGATHNAVASGGAESNMRWGVGLSFREGASGTGTWMPDSRTSYKFYITTMYDDMKQESLPQLMAMYSSPNLAPTYTSNTLDFTADGDGTGSSSYSKVVDSASKFLEHGFAPGQQVVMSGWDDDEHNNTTVELTYVVNNEIRFDKDGTYGDDTDNDTSVTIAVTDSYEFTATEPSDTIKKAGYTNDDDAWNSHNLSWQTKTAESAIKFCDFRKLAATGQNTRAWFTPIFKINGAEHGAEDNGNNPANSRKFVFGNGNDASEANYGNPRISGVRMYWASNDDGYSTLWQMFDVDFAKGVKSFGIDDSAGETGYAPFYHRSLFPGSGDTGDGDPDGSVNSTTTGIYIQPSFPFSNRWLHPPRFRTYFENNEHEHDDVIDVNYYKTAVVANDRVYIGNVGQTIDGADEQFPDRILKSPYGQPDKFPSKNYLQIGENDGDAIIHLATFADRLLQFNNNVMYIINISQDAEYVEDIHRFKGVHHSASVCTADDGIVWANENGVFVYTGKEVRNLLELKNGRLIDDATWKDFVTNSDGDIRPSIGYSAKKREVLVVDDIGDKGAGNMYIFNVNTGGWVYAPAAVGDNIKTNLHIDYNNDLIFFNYSDNQMYKWDNTASDKSSNVTMITKDIDFGSPAVRKKIFKVYITYKCSADTNIKAVYDKNGSTSFGYDFAAGTNYTSSTLDSTSSAWAQAELKPDDSSEANNAYSFQLKLYSTGTVPADFEINDISIVYREKAIK